VSHAGGWIGPARHDTPGRGVLERAALRSEAAALWTEALERTVSVESERCPPQGLPVCPLDAVVGFLWAGEVCQMHVPCHLLVDRLRPLAGLRSALVADAPPPGPLPLTLAEEGLLAWLAMGWFSLLPPPRPVFAWVAGPGGDRAPPPGPNGAVLWRVTLDGAPPGLVRWLVGDREPEGVVDPGTETVMVCPRAEPVEVDTPGPLRSGDLVLLEPGPWPLHVTLPDHRTVRATLCGEALLLGPRVPGVPGATAPLRMPPRPPRASAAAGVLQIELAPLSTTTEASARFGPGSRLPLPKGGLRGTLRHGQLEVAGGRLVELGGHLALEVDRVGRPSQSS
jgi:hypothetical protein